MVTTSLTLSVRPVLPIATKFNTGWAEFEYEGQGKRRLEKGDVINQRPGIRHREIACSDDLKILEIVAPANFKTEIVNAPAEAAD
jgi:hypothetical protein